MDIRHAVGVKEGMPEEKLSNVLAYRESSYFNERERAALEFSERTIRDDLEVSDECMLRLREYFAQPEIVELAFIIGYQTFASKFAKSFRLAPQGLSSRSTVGLRS
jgi:alkylhydroperoxidase family enzyme